MNIIYRRIRRPDAALVRRAQDCTVSDLYEALPAAIRDKGLMSPRMRPLCPGLRIAGPAVTARCAPGDNLMMHRALQLAQAGDVLVVAAAERPAAQWGTLAMLYARKKGLAGVIVDGCIRDADALFAAREPVWSTAISPAHPDKSGAGAVNAPIACDGVTVNPGDVVCADMDGVLVIPGEHLAAAVAGAEARATHEKQVADALAAGTITQIHDLSASFARAGIPEVDRCWDDPA